MISEHPKRRLVEGSDLTITVVDDDRLCCQCCQGELRQLWDSLSHEWQTVVAPLLVAAAIYLLLMFVLLPIYHRYRANISRYAQYAPLNSTLQSTTSIFGEYMPEALRAQSIRDRIGNLFGTVLPTWTRSNQSARRDSVVSEDGGLFDEESGERMIGFDMNGDTRGRRGRLGVRDAGETNAINAAIGRVRDDGISTRRLSRELEEGFMDDSASEMSDEEVTVGRRRASVSANR